LTNFLNAVKDTIEAGYRLFLDNQAVAHYGFPELVE
jgi:hypothetical protein